jgi:L-threonylcarbamoyladenylate synthase
MNLENLAQKLKNKEIGVILTDTIYGIIGLAQDNEISDRIYSVKKRDKDKPFIILISSIDDLRKFNIIVDETQRRLLGEFWPGPTSVVLGDLAFRIPKKEDLIELINLTGPLIATSVNRQGETPINNINDAQDCFKDELDFYIDSGECKNSPSILVKLDGEDVYILRGKICLRN